MEEDTEDTKKTSNTNAELMNELVHQNRTQNDNIATILQLLKGMQSEMKDTRGEITQLRKKCDDMHTDVSSDMKSGFDDV